MKLLMGPTSPFARKVAAVIHELQLADRIEQRIVTTTPLKSDPGVVAANPLGKIPSLIREDGCTLYDSRVICRYLDSLVGGTLYPKARQWETLTLEATGDAIMDAGVSMIYELRMRPDDKQWDGWMDAQWAKITAAMDALEGRWMSHLAGPLDIGQISVACALSYIEFRHGHREWRAARPQLATWLDVFCKRESMQKTRPE
ncbi:glutathione S-transferase [Pelagivirga sediminicola]|uniref:Glutathione S-transferase n=1 Tax=Pelagivirga sediminicola TaxID=2170575 RepID=A0A2T7G6Z0_9RHOB|nr:glutathione S-transferase [Pelagivirga sediminicola]PVA10201.1 glutathione S-transferase [Pelagivirga sediminicola]